MIHNTPNEIAPTRWKDYLATAMGAIVALTTSWLLIDWNTFEFSPKNIFVLCLSGANALAGFFTKLK